MQHAQWAKLSCTLKSFYARPFGTKPKPIYTNPQMCVGVAPYPGGFTRIVWVQLSGCSCQEQTLSVTVIQLKNYPGNQSMCVFIFCKIIAWQAFNYGFVSKMCATWSTGLSPQNLIPWVHLVCESGRSLLHLERVACIFFGYISWIALQHSFSMMLSIAVWHLFTITCYNSVQWKPCIDQW